MSKTTYKLRVPVPTKETTVPEFVSHGNLEATLEHGKIFETDNEHFARHLVDRYGLTIEETVEPEPPAATAGGETETPVAAYPEDFPGREALIEHGVPFETAVTLDAEQLRQYKGIGPKTADEIVKFVAENGGN